MIPNRGILIGRLLFFILLLAAVLRFYGLDRLGLWADELWVVMDSSQGSLRDMLLTVYYQDNHPPGYYLLSRYTQIVLGSSDFAIRLPSALAGILLIAATFVAGRKHLSPEAALIAAVLVAGSYQAIYYSQEARANIFVALFSLLSLHYFRALALEEDVRPKNFMAFWLFATLNNYFHYAGLVFTASLAFIYLCLLADRHNKACLASGVKIFFPVLLFYLPWLPGMYHDLVASPPEAWQYSPTPQTLVSTFIFLFGPGDVRIYGYGAVLAMVPLWIIAVMFIKPWQQRYAGSAKIAALLWFCIILPLAFFYLKSVYFQSAYNRRHFLYAIPLLSLLFGALLAYGLDYFSEKNRSKVLVVVIALIVSYQLLINNNYALYSSNHFKQDYRESARIVVNELSGAINNDTLIISNSEFFDHYLQYFSGGRLTSNLIINKEGRQDLLDQMMENESLKSFYYLEAPLIPAANQMVTERDQLMAQKYKPSCRTKLVRTQVIHFEIALPVAGTAIDWAALPTCITKK